MMAKSIIVNIYQIHRAGQKPEKKIRWADQKLRTDTYMKTKKALAGLLGLLGSFAAFLLALVGLTGFLLTASLLYKHTKSFQKQENEKANAIHPYKLPQPWILSDLKHELRADAIPEHEQQNWIRRPRKKNWPNWDLLGVGLFGVGFASFHGDSCSLKIGSVEIWSEEVGKPIAIMEGRGRGGGLPGWCRVRVWRWRWRR